MAQSRTLFAWLSVFLAGGLAARTAKSEPARSLKASQTSFRLNAWLICAYSIVTTWLHELYVRLFTSTPVNRANFGVRCGGINWHTCRRTVNWPRFGCIGFLFFTPCLVAGKNLPAEPLFLHRNHEFLWDGNEFCPWNLAKKPGRTRHSRRCEQQ